MTTGTIIFYGGIAGAVVLGVLALILIHVTAKKRKKLLERILKENA